MEYKMLEGENPLEFASRIVEDKMNKIIKTWDDFCNICNSATGEKHSESYWRKNIQGTYGTEPKYTKEKFEDLKALEKSTAEQLRELEIAKIQYRDERNAWNKQNYISARVGQKLDYLEEQLLSVGKRNFPSHKTSVKIDSDNDMLVMLSDFHIGQCFKNEFGTYNSDIAAQRLDELLDEIMTIQKRHKSQNCYVVLLGDMISGNIHKNIQVTNRENVIDQIKIASELIASFCDQLCVIFNQVTLSDVTGNHSRIDRKDEAIHDERLDCLISWAVGLYLTDVDNFKVLNNHLDSGISELSIRGKSYIAVHGDCDAMTQNGINKLSSMIGKKPDYILMAHMHSPAFNEFNGTKVIRGGSLSGSGDQNTIEKRLSGKASQTVCICTNRCLECMYPVELS